MEVLVDRDSVAAGDDTEPHAQLFTFPDDLAIEDVIERIVATGYLPTIAGGSATWSVTSGVPLAVVAQQWTKPERVSWQPINADKLAHRDGVVGLRFNYHAQEKPEVVLEILKRLRLEPFTS